MRGFQEEGKNEERGGGGGKGKGKKGVSRSVRNPLIVRMVNCVGGGFLDLWESPEDSQMYQKEKN